MTHTQQYLDQLFERFPVGELGGSPFRDTFEQLRNQCAGTDDLETTLRQLYRVERCDDLALGLLWVAERTRTDLSRLEPSEEEEAVVFRGLRKSLGLSDPVETTWSPEPNVAPAPDESPAADRFEEPAPQLDAIMDLPPVMEGPGPETDSTESGSVAPVGEATADPTAFGRQLEQFLEAVQGGSDERAPLLEMIRASCTAIGSESTTPDDLRPYAENLNGFLQYVMDNQLLDDVRVMNLVTNIQDPYAQWISTAEGERTGLLDQATELLRDFRTMFE